MRQILSQVRRRAGVERQGQGATPSVAPIFRLPSAVPRRSSDDCTKSSAGHGGHREERLGTIEAILDIYLDHCLSSTGGGAPTVSGPPGAEPNHG